MGDIIIRIPGDLTIVTIVGFYRFVVECFSCFDVGALRFALALERKKKQAYHIFTSQVTIKHVMERIQELTCVDVDGIEAEASIAPPTENDRTGGVGATSNDECATMIGDDHEGPLKGALEAAVLAEGSSRNNDELVPILFHSSFLLFLMLLDVGCGGAAGRGGLAALAHLLLSGLA
uniref:Uncharacterized protein n=1 Tax=Oryza barthii TaxID=65489 RepID=A0A0D3F4I2_9ORYZ